MPSERRLHPLSFVFDIVGQVRQFVVPAGVVLVGAGSAGFAWEAWLVLLVIPSAVVAFVRALTFRYRFDPGELVITSGLIFRNVRHVPYGRIQNIDAVQNILHRLLRVVEVRIETGGGNEAEARMRVLPLPALAEMRERVFASRPTPSVGEPAAADSSRAESQPERRTLLSLGPRELLLAGFIESRGLIIVGAAFGLLWELGLFESTAGLVFGENLSSRSLVRQAGRSLLGLGTPSIGRLAILVLVFAAFVLAIRVLSMGWSLIRLWGFRLHQTGDDLGTEFGLVTRVMATIPVRRIQTVTVRQGPLHRAFKAASIRVDSAGGDGGEGSATKRESLAPIIRRADLAGVLAEVLPDVDVAGAAWRPVESARLLARTESIARPGRALDAPVHPHAAVVDAGLGRGARRVGDRARAALCEPPRMGRRRAGGPFPERLAVARVHRRALQQDTGGHAERVALRPARPHGERRGRYRRRRRCLAPRRHPVSGPLDRRRALPPARGRGGADRVQVVTVRTPQSPSPPRTPSARRGEGRNPASSVGRACAPTTSTN